MSFSIYMGSELACCFIFKCWQQVFTFLLTQVVMSDGAFVVHSPQSLAPYHMVVFGAPALTTLGTFGFLLQVPGFLQCVAAVGKVLVRVIPLRFGLVTGLAS